MRKILYILITGLVCVCCTDTKMPKEVYRSEALMVERVSENVYRHISYLDTEDYGKVTCNGMIVTNNGEAVVFDTTTDDQSSGELIDWVTMELKCDIIAVVPTHYHTDNLGGLDEFHKRGIPSYAYDVTIEIARRNGDPVPQNSFDDFLGLDVGGKNIYAGFLGEGHTRDNIIGYYPSQDIMFGGCLVKAMGSGKGNLEEANPEAWPATIKKVASKYPDVKIIIPGHGDPGGRELLEYTINLFEKEN